MNPKLSAVRASLPGSIVCLLMLFPSLLFSYRVDDAVRRASGSGISLASLPRMLGQWRGEDTSKLDARSQDILRLDEYVRRVYKAPDGRSVFAYIGYWKRQSGEHQA